MMPAAPRAVPQPLAAAVGTKWTGDDETTCEENLPYPATAGAKTVGEFVPQVCFATPGTPDLQNGSV